MKLLAVDGTNVVMRYACAMLGKAVADPLPRDVIRVVEAAERAAQEFAALVCASRAVVALDAPGSWRRELYPAYKANREAGGTSGWSASFGGHLARAGWNCISAPDFEADDCLATAATRAVAAGNQAAILSSDSDLLALAGDEVSVYQFGSGSGRDGEPRHPRRDPEWIAAHYGIRRGQLPLYKALVGEPGDNLPGVRGCGPVKARKVLKAYPTAEEIIESGIVARREFELMLQLVTLRTDVPLGPICPARIPRASCA